jgi:hypothetical protein
MPTLALTVTGDRSPERLDQLRAELLRDLARLPGVTPSRDAAPPSPGAKGAGLAEVMVLALGAGGAVSGLVACLRGYLERDRTLAFELRCPDGTIVRLTGQRLSADEGAIAMRALELCLAAGGGDGTGDA